MKTVPLSGAKSAGRVALVDDEDFALVMQYRWHVRESVRRGRPSGPYAESTTTRAGQVTSIFMHNLITGHLGTDHVNHDGLDNQRHNLRTATVAQQNQNRRAPVHGRSPYKGVAWRESGRRWTARIRINGERYQIGSFATELEAARAYDLAARKAFGSYALLNFPEEQSAMAAAERAAEALAADTGTVLRSMSELVRSGARYGALGDQFGDARVLECLTHALNCVKGAS